MTETPTPLNYDRPIGCIDKGTLRYMALTKVYPDRHFRCDSCGQEYQQATFYSLAYNEIELPYKRTYCEKCLSRTLAGRIRLAKNEEEKKEKLMTKKLTKNTKTKKTISLPNISPAHSPAKKTKGKNTTEYYQCLADSWGTDKITACCQKCSKDAPALLAQKAEQKAKEIALIKKSWEQIGMSLMKLVKE